MVKKETKIYDDFEIDFPLKATSRKLLKDQTINKFLEEKNGYWENGIQHVTRYKYFVEKLADERRVFLLRPTFLNKGIDFQVWVEKMKNDEDKRPSHKDIFEDLRIKRKENPKDLPTLIECINRVWNCAEPNEVLKDNKLNFKNGFSAELLLKILKWLFVEQDITYWNYSGREMLKKGIDKEFSS